MSEIDENLLSLMPECQAIMREVGDLLRDKSCHDWQKHGAEIHGAAAIMDSWIEGIKSESKNGKNYPNNKEIIDD